MFHFNCIELKKYLYKEVEIISANDKKFRGRIYTIDPVSRSVALIIDSATENRNKTLETINAEGINSVISSSHKFALKILVGSNIRSIVYTNETVDENLKQKFDSLFLSEELIFTEQETKNRKERIKNWLRVNRIPFEENNEDDTIIILQVLTVRRPFTVDSCFCTNEIILSRIRKLLESMPDEF